MPTSLTSWWFLMFTTIMFLKLGLCEATCKICPAISVNITHQGPFGAINYVQRGIWHQVPCPSFRPDEAISRVIWFKRERLMTPNKTLITHKSEADYPESDRYAFGTSGFSLVIKGVEESDGGKYVCLVTPRGTPARVEEINIHVIGDTFPGGSSQVSSTASLQRGRRQTLPCECATQSPDVVYWSMGEDVTSDTQIIGARFSGGATLQIQHGADYIIGSDASLTVNSLNDVQDTQRFWCHVFQSDGFLRNCNTNVQISVELESASDALKASERSFYLRNDTQQILPCLSWTPGDAACKVEWSKLGNPDWQTLSYNLSTGVVDSSPEFDIASDFGLVIQSVDDVHAGVYRCAVGDKHQIDVEVRVIGDRFPLDGGSAIEGYSVAFKPESSFSIQCPALSNITLTTTSTVFWSYGHLDAQTTTIIGMLNVVPDSAKMTFDLLANDCFDLSTKGALFLSVCPQDGDVRYWCHVFPANDDLIRSYVDVLIKNSNGDRVSYYIVAIAVCVPLFVIVLLGIVRFHIAMRGPRSWRNREDRERGVYIGLDVQESVEVPYLKMLAAVFVINKYGRIPITPWCERDDACFASIDMVYRPLEMFINLSSRGYTVRYHLDSESGIFDDGIPELASKHAIIQGRRGCGKTTFLYRLIYDWAMGRQRALWGRDQIVVLVPAWLLIKAKTIGEAVVECMLPKDANISAESINAHYARDKSNLAILVDDCNDEDDIDAVMKVMTDNELLGCQLVLTTRNAELAKTASQKHNMRHVTITGFTLRNAIKYVNVVLDTVEERKKVIPGQKAVKGKAVPTAGSTANINIEQHLPDTKQSAKVPAPPETKESYAFDENLEKIETSKTHTKNKRNLHRYLKRDILQPDISCLPAVLVALCQMSIWTKGDAFKLDVTMANLFCRLVKCMFDRMTSLKVGVTEGNQLSLFRDEQLDVLKKLGRVAYQRLVESCGNNADFSKEDFLSSSEGGDHVLEFGIELGLIRPLKVKSKVESAEQSSRLVSSEALEVEIRIGFRCRLRQQSLTERDQMRQDPELTRLTSPEDERICFVSVIVEQLCVGAFLAGTKGKVTKWFADITKKGHMESLERFSNIFQFVIQYSQFDTKAFVDSCVKIISSGYSQVRPLHVVLQLQKIVELCLLLNFERQCEGALNKKLKPIFPDGRVRLIGISSYKLRLLSYLLEHAQPKHESKLNVKSVELLRIGRYDWSELQEYIAYFAPGQKGLEKGKSVATKTEDSQPATTIDESTDPASQKDIKKLPEFQPSLSHPAGCADNYSAQEVVKSSKAQQPHPDAELEPKSKTGQTTAPDPQNDMVEYLNRTPQTDQSQSITHQSSVSHQQSDNGQTSVTTFPRTDPRNEPKSSAPGAKIGYENAHTSVTEFPLGKLPNTTQNQNDTSKSSETRPSSFHPGVVNESLSCPGGRGNKSDALSQSTLSEPSEDGGNEDKSMHLSIDEYIASYRVIDSEKKVAVFKKLREKIESSNQDMPRFPPDESDISVLHTVHSLGLQELLESQTGKCYSSGAERDLVHCLPRLKMLESLVLVGTILSSKAICDLAKNACRLPNLKKLDLRLNSKFGDRAFVAVTDLPLRKCTKLTDLRLSLYKVSDKGFNHVQSNIEKKGKDSWERLKTLYLLHGSPAEKFVGFLSNSLKYFNSVQSFHLSATGQEEKIRNSVLEQFEQNMKNPKIMPKLKDLVIGNMEILQARLASLKLPKKKVHRSLKTVETTVAELEEQTAKDITKSAARNTSSEVAESEDRMMASEVAESVGIKTVSEVAESVDRKTAKNVVESVGIKTSF